MNWYKKIFRNILYNWAGFLLNLIIAFFMSPFIVHRLGNTYYGVWVIMMQLTGYLGILELGVRSSIVKYVSEYHGSGETEKINQAVNAAISIYTIVGLISFAISCIIAVIFPLIFNLSDASIFVTRVIIIITGVTVAQDFIFNTFYGILMGIQRYDIHNKVGMLFTLIRSFFIILFLMIGEGIVALAVIHLVASFASNMTIVYYCKKQLPVLKIAWFRNTGSAYRMIFKYSSQSFFIRVSQKLVYQTDSFIIGIFMNLSAVTFFSIPGTLIEYMRRLVIAMTEIFVPVASELDAKNDSARMRRLLIYGTRISLSVGLPICIVFLIMGEQFISLWMGEDYAKAGINVLIILTITQIFSLTHLTSREILYGLAKQWICIYCYGGEAVANILLSVILVRSHGIEGVAIGTAIPHIAVVLFAFPVIISRIIGINVWDYIKEAFLPPMVPSIVFASGCLMVTRFWIAESLFTYFLSIMILLPLFLIPAWFTCLGKEERYKCRYVVEKAFVGTRRSR